MIQIIAMVSFGTLFTWLGARALLSGSWRESIPAAEYLINRAAGMMPPPRNKWDRRFALLQAWLSFLFGLIALATGLVVLLGIYILSE
ncbi:hypothetical protein ACMGDH_06615 [Sphingomonas sp. DT-207]|uniref:hypothetical protein n=1 Tax=Sphingomonas sp. DT-207 TaxID=3396167 RepID=UPI003F1C2140